LGRQGKEKEDGERKGGRKRKRDAPTDASPITKSIKCYFLNSA
jgi:hypothetical protein